MRRHLLIPDTQVKKGVSTDHMDWIGAAIQKYKPNSVIHLGDHWDCPSLSAWDAKGSLSKEGARYEDDIQSGNEALDRLHKAMGDFKGQKVILRGNHEHRIQRAIEQEPRFVGTIGEHHFNDKRLGWEIVPYFHGSPGTKVIDGVTYAHFFANPMTGKAIAGTITNRLAKIGTTFVQGHAQGLLQGNVQYATGVVRHGIVAGSAYIHDEEYKGHANAHWRGIVVLNEVKNGQFCEMPLTLDYLCREFEGTSLARFLQRKYRRAKERFSLARAA